MWKDSDKLVEIYNHFIEGGTKVPYECPECNSEAVHKIKLPHPKIR